MLFHLLNRSGRGLGCGRETLGIAALVIAVIALVPARATDTSLDLYVHATYIVVTPRHAILAFALLCGAFAGLYYFVGHALGNRLNDALTLTHFLLWLFSPIIFILEALGLRRADQAGRDPSQSRLLLAGFVAPFLAFAVGAAVFLANFVRAIVLKHRNPS